MLALAGTIQGNTIIIENDSIANYDGKEVILTILDHPYKKRTGKIDWDKYGMNGTWKTRGNVYGGNKGQ